MVTIEESERKEFKTSWDLRGLSSDTKPTEIDGKPVPNGSTYLCLDTSEVYFYDAASQSWMQA